MTGGSTFIGGSKGQDTDGWIDRWMWPDRTGDVILEV